MKRYIKYIIFSGLIFILMIFTGIFYISNRLPDIYYIGENDARDFSICFFNVKEEKSYDCFAKKTANFENADNFYHAKLVFMNLIPIKNVKVKVSEDRYVAVCGIPFGVKMYTKGAIVIGLLSVKSENGVFLPWQEAKIKKGDIISFANEKEIKSNDDLEEVIRKSDGKTINLKIIRENEEFETNLTPVKSIDYNNEYKAGIWVRDSSAGIGTLTFFDKKNNSFAGLGHGVFDADTSYLLPLAKGEIVSAKITNIVKGKPGIPGELKGIFTNQNSVGKILSNNETGLYGKLEKSFYCEKETPVAMKQNVKKGKAQILTTIDSDIPELFDINIDSINYDTTIPTKNMKISVTDIRLLDKTGGIVQGMSGSPILQDGYLVGAITHVFVNKPSKGYAIFAETMLTNSNFFLESNHKNIS